MDELKNIMASVLGIKAEKITGSFAKNDNEWDSFNHLMLISKIEKKLGIKFTIKDIESIKNYRDLKGIVQKKIKGN